MPKDFHILIIWVICPLHFPIDTSNVDNMFKIAFGRIFSLEFTYRLNRLFKISGQHMLLMQMMLGRPGKCRDEKWLFFSRPKRSSIHCPILGDEQTFNPTYIHISDWHWRKKCTDMIYLPITSVVMPWTCSKRMVNNVGSMVMPLPMSICMFSFFLASLT